MQWISWVLALGGGALIFGAPYFVFLPTKIQHIAADFGIAFVISGVLGLTVERYTRRKFVKELANDVFEAVIGHMLPEELRQEMREIYGQKALCETHNQDVRIERIDGDRVRLICDMERRIKNISGKDTEIPIGLSIDEWFDAEPSLITAFGYRVEDQPKVMLDCGDLNYRHEAKGRPTLAPRTTPSPIVPKDKTVTVWWSSVEYKPVNSDYHAHFSYCTRNPRVRVFCDDSLEAVVTFPRESQTNKTEHIKGAFQYQGLMLTGQDIRIRWWERSREEAWRTAADAKGGQTHEIERA